MSETRIARTTGLQILQNRGVIRGITNWGQFDLPKPTTKYQTQHHAGHYFIIQFDSSARIQQEIRRTLGLDPRMIRFTVVKVGDKLGGKKGSIENVTGQIPWHTDQEEDFGLFGGRRNLKSIFG